MDIMSDFLSRLPTRVFCVFLCRSWPERNKAGQKKWSQWRIIGNFLRRRWIMVTTRLCNSWRQRSNSELSTVFIIIRAVTHYKVPSFWNVRIVWCFGSPCCLFLRYHLVLQETNEERRTVANNLASVFTTAANHLSIIEVILFYLFISSPIVYLMYTVKKKKGINAIQFTVVVKKIL